MLSIIFPLILYIIISKFIISKMCISLFISLCANIIVCILIYFGVGYILKNEAIIFSLNKIKELFYKNRKKHI